MNILDETIELGGKIVSTVIVGGFAMWIINILSHQPRNIGEPVAQGLVFVLLCLWWLFFISPDMWDVTVRPTCQGCNPEIDDPDVYFCDICNLLPSTTIPKKQLPWAHRRAGGREFRS